MMSLRWILLIAIVGLQSAPASAVVWPLAEGQDVVGEVIEDRLRGDQRPLDLARMHNIGHHEIRAANPEVDPWLPDPGRSLRIPQLHILPDGPREGIVVNLSERRLYYFAETWPDRDGPVVDTHAVGVGLFDRATPVITTRVSARLEDPAWYPNDATRAYYAREGRELPSVVPPGPEKSKAFATQAAPAFWRGTFVSRDKKYPKALLKGRPDR
jgi:L,D-transpeptidase ErfK/SrfK